jgi:hypothetical protein
MEITIKTVEQYIREHPGCTQKQIAAAFPNNNKLYGSHKFVASAVTELRRMGKVEDVERCDKCGRAMTRGRPNAPLYIIGELL